MKRVIGIDPGAHGALAHIFDFNGGLVFTVHATAKKPPIESLREAVGSEPEHCVAYLERIGGFIAGKSLPGSAMFKMGHNAGYWEGALAALKVRTILVRPQQWQAGIPGVAVAKEKPARKRALRDEALRRFPSAEVTLDTCDALLIADYGFQLERVAPQKPSEETKVDAKPDHET